MQCHSVTAQKIRFTAFWAVLIFLMFIIWKQDCKGSRKMVFHMNMKFIQEYSMCTLIFKNFLYSSLNTLNNYKIIFISIENTTTFPLKNYNESKLQIKLDEKYKWYEQVVNYNKTTNCMRHRKSIQNSLNTLFQRSLHFSEGKSSAR